MTLCESVFVRACVCLCVCIYAHAGRMYVSGGERQRERMNE